MLELELSSSWSSQANEAELSSRSSRARPLFRPRARLDVDHLSLKRVLTSLLRFSFPADSFRGGRGSARGAFRGAPRGLPRSLGSANGHLPGTPVAVATPEASSSTPTALGSKSSWADQVEDAESSAAATTAPAVAEDSADAGGWDLSPTPAVAPVEEKKVEEKKPITNGASAAAKGKAPVRSGVIPQGSKMSWAQIAR